MKTRISVIVCVLLALCMVCAFAEKKMSAKEFLDSYEKFVVEVEKAAEKGNYGTG